MPLLTKAKEHALAKRKKLYVAYKQAEKAGEPLPECTAAELELSPRAS